MPESGPMGNTPEATEAEKARRRAEIIKLKTEIVEEEERIERIQNPQSRAIEQNVLNAKRGLLEIRMNEYSSLN